MFKFIYILFIVLQSTISLATDLEFRPIGLEFEYAGSGETLNISKSEGYISLLRFVKNKFPGDQIKLLPWNRYSDAMNTKYAFFTDLKGRQWKVVPEIMTEDTYDGYELITPPLNSVNDIEAVSLVLDQIQNSSLFITGKYSSTHYTADISDFISADSNISKFVDVILFIENHILEIYHMIQPARYGLVMNTFAVPLSFNQRALLTELSSLSRINRTYDNVRNLFLKYQDEEFILSGNENEHRWKFRAFNYGKFLQLGDFKFSPTLEMRLSDLVDSKDFVLVGRLFEALIRVGSETPSNEFKDPFSAIDHINRDQQILLSAASEHIKTNLNAGTYYDLLKLLDLNPNDYPPYSRIRLSLIHQTRTQPLQFNSCRSYLH